MACDGTSAWFEQSRSRVRCGYIHFVLAGSEGRKHWSSLWYGRFMPLRREHRLDHGITSKQASTRRESVPETCPKGSHFGHDGVRQDTTPAIPRSREPLTPSRGVLFHRGAHRLRGTPRRQTCQFRAQRRQAAEGLKKSGKSLVCAPGILICK